MKLRHAGTAAALAAALLLNLAAWGARGAAQSDANRAGLVVQFKDGSVVTRCVTFDQPDMTGYDLLRRADLPVAVDAGSMGATVCKIGNDGCDVLEQACFCECQDLGGACAYWIYFVSAGDKWRYSILGASGQKVVDGSVHGWIWGTGKADGADVAPPLLSFEDICSAPAPTATVEASDAPTPAPAPPSDAKDGAGTPPGGLPDGLVAFGLLAAGLGGILLLAQRRAGKGGRLP